MLVLIRGFVLVESVESLLWWMNEDCGCFLLEQSKSGKNMKNDTYIIAAKSYLNIKKGNKLCVITLKACGQQLI